MEEEEDALPRGGQPSEWYQNSEAARQPRRGVRSTSSTLTGWRNTAAGILNFITLALLLLCGLIDGGVIHIAVIAASPVLQAVLPMITGLMLGLIAATNRLLNRDPLPLTHLKGPQYLLAAGFIVSVALGCLTRFPNIIDLILTHAISPIWVIGVVSTWSVIGSIADSEESNVLTELFLLAVLFIPTLIAFGVIPVAAVASNPALQIACLIGGGFLYGMLRYFLKDKAKDEPRFLKALILSSALPVGMAITLGYGSTFPSIMSLTSAHVISPALVCLVLGLWMSGAIFLKWQPGAAKWENDPKINKWHALFALPVFLFVLELTDAIHFSQIASTPALQSAMPVVAGFMLGVALALHAYSETKLRNTLTSAQAIVEQCTYVVTGASLGFAATCLLSYKTGYPSLIHQIKIHGINPYLAYGFCIMIALIAVVGMVARAYDNHSFSLKGRATTEGTRRNNTGISDRDPLPEPEPTDTRPSTMRAEGGDDEYVYEDYEDGSDNSDNSKRTFS